MPSSRPSATSTCKAPALPATNNSRLLLCATSVFSVPLCSQGWPLNKDKTMKPTYQTTDLTLTSFLRYNAFTTESIKQTNGRTLFVFQESPELRTAILDFAND